MKRSWLVVAAAIPLVVIASVAVWKVSGDDTRRQGALSGSDGVNLSWRGDWSKESEYVPGNVVSFEGASYVAESEKLAAPQPGCSECGWARLAVEDPPDEAEPAAPAEPVIRGYEVATRTQTVQAGATGQLLISCPTGKMPLNGGTTSSEMRMTGGGLLRIDVVNGVRTGTWGVGIANTSGYQRDIQLFAVCAKVD